MSIKFENINLLDADVQYICHQVNCQGKMNSGVARAIREKYPEVFERYIKKYNQNVQENKGMNTLLNNIQIVNVTEEKSVINLFSQFDYGYDGTRYTSYDAFNTCIERLHCLPQGATIAFPYKIGCDRGGANWQIIFPMIMQLSKKYDITICYLKEDDWIKAYKYLSFQDLKDTGVIEL